MFLVEDQLTVSRLVDFESAFVPFPQFPEFADAHSERESRLMTIERNLKIIRTKRSRLIGAC